MVLAKVLRAFLDDDDRAELAVCCVNIENIESFYPAVEDGFTILEMKSGIMMNIKMEFNDFLSLMKGDESQDLYFNLN